MDLRGTHDSTGRAHLLARIRAHIDDHLADPGLSPGTVARAHHISVCYLHRLFGAEGITVARFIRQRRLDRCAREPARGSPSPRRCPPSPGGEGPSTRPTSVVRSVPSTAVPRCSGAFFARRRSRAFFARRRSGRPYSSPDRPGGTEDAAHGPDPAAGGRTPREWGSPARHPVTMRSTAASTSRSRSASENTSGSVSCSTMSQLNVRMSRRTAVASPGSPEASW